MSTKINWTDETWNPIIGCNKISPGCSRCYAQKMATRLANIKNTNYYQNVIHKSRWNNKTYFVESQLQKPLKWKKPRMIFVVSMGDLFHESVPFEWVDKVFNIIRNCPQHTFQILTKRPERMLEFSNWLLTRNRLDYTRLSFWPLNNVWLGTTIENQDQIKRVHDLLKCPAKVHFISVEPMLSEINFNEYYFQSKDGTYPFKGVPYKDRTKLIHLFDWVICGGESGHNARPVHPDWVRSLRDQCETANVPFFFKQWGEWLAISQMNNNQLDDLDTDYLHDKNKVNKELDPHQSICKVGKKNAGCLLDGKEYKQFPKIL